jgi:peroxiredoxin
MSLQIGQNAPGLTLPDTEKQKVSIGNFKGKNVVLFFFPMAWTSTCTREMCTVQEDFNSYKELNAVVIGISVDTLYALKRYKEDYKLDSVILLSDFNKNVIRSYDVVHHDFSNGYKDVAKRATFVIDKDGMIRFAEVLPNLGDFPDLDAVKKTLSLLA